VILRCTAEEGVFIGGARGCEFWVYIHKSASGECEL
jgi:hypothetical protein